MNKKYIITFSISVLVLFTLSVVGLMLLVPQQPKVSQGVINNYQSIQKSDYTYESTKDLSDQTLTKQYTISTEDIQQYTSGKQYKPGNADPFTSSTTGGSNGNTGNTGNSGNSNNGNTTTNPDDKTTNSNGGTPNPPASSK